MTLNYNLELNASPHLEDNQRYLRIRTTCNSKRIYSASLGITIDLSQWDEAKQRCGNRSVHNGVSSARINAIINRYCNACQMLIDRYLLANHAPSKEEWKEAIAPLLSIKPARPELSASVTDCWRRYLEESEANRSWSLATKRRAKNVASLWCSYNSTTPLDQWDASLIDGWIDFQFNRELRNSTVQKNVSCLRTFLRWCQRQHLYDGTLHDDYTMRLKSVSNASKQIVYLEWNELMQFLSYDFGQKEYLARARDIFCFCSFSSLRYSDVKALRRQDIYDDALHIVTRKTADCLTIELNKYTRAILIRYKDCWFPEGRALPVPSMQRYNDYLHEAAAIVGLDRMVRHTYFVREERIDEVRPLHAVLSSHAARRTFIVQSLRLGIPAEVVMKWTGHSDYDAMKPYIEIVQELRRTSMSLFDV